MEGGIVLKPPWPPRPTKITNYFVRQHFSKTTLFLIYLITYFILFYFKIRLLEEKRIWLFSPINL